MYICDEKRNGKWKGYKKESQKGRITIRNDVKMDKKKEAEKLHKY